MPLLRYFVYVGGALLALLLVSNAVLPPVPLPSTLTSASDLPPVRIHSELKLPERVVFDTSSTVSRVSVPVLVAPATVARAVVPAPTPAAAAPLAEIPPKARIRGTFAQLPEGVDVSAPKNGKTALVAMAEPKTVFKPLPKRKVARPRTSGPVMQVAQQPHFGLFW